MLLAIRDDETRLRFGGYRTWVFKAGVFGVAGTMAGLGGALYLPQKGIITPGDMAPYWSILVVAWVAIGGRGTVWGAVIGAIGVSAMYSLDDLEPPGLLDVRPRRALHPHAAAACRAAIMSLFGVGRGLLAGRTSKAGAA